MIFDALQTVIGLLTPASVTLDDLTAHLGAVQERFPNNTHLTPSEALWRSLNVVQGYDSAQVSHVELALATPLALSDLSAHYGEYKRVVPDKGPIKALFSLHYADQPHDIALIAQLDGPEKHATALTLRRDAR
jgi:hypothetical protein